MSKKLIFCLFFLSAVVVVSAQDVILKVTGEEINAKVTEVSGTEVKYKKFGNESGPAYTLSKSDVFMISYENGEKDVFGRGQKTATAPVAVQTSVPQVITAANLPPASKAYNMGDIYDENGVKGIVVKVTDGGRHGLIMSLKVSTDKWLKDKDAKFSTGAFYEDDGEKNSAAIEQFINSGASSWEDFPLFNWAKNLGAGWYIPANDELTAIAEAVNGGTGTEQTYSEKKVKEFGKKIKKGKGNGLLADGFGQDKGFRQMFSSTEAEGGMIYSLWFKENTGSAITGSLAGGLIKPAKKGKLVMQQWSKTLFTGGSFTGMVGSRAVHKF
jgi:hypothetical protein